jgi:Zn-dependent M16 (insulinase) family peptidase
MIRLLALALVLVSPARAALKDLKEGQSISSFTVHALYLNASDEPMGARFIYKNGMPVDVLFFASVPQISVFAKTLPVGEKGEPHTGEHLLIGKGRIGKYLNSLLGMRLAGHTAATFDDLTNYQFHTEAGPEGFYEVLENYLQALLHPEFTDEEIRREVENLGTDRAQDGTLHLDEKGTVYQEMVSTMEKPGSVNWDQMKRMVFGPTHPLARNAGGLPAALRELTPEEVRRFHDANYRLGPNMEMVAALPLSYTVEDFLAKLDGIFAKLQPQDAPNDYAKLPPPQPLDKPEIQIGKFPSDDLNVPQSALFVWKVEEGLSMADETRLGLLLSLAAGGETSYLYRDLVDGKTRLLNSGATGVSGWIDSPPQDFPAISVDGLPAANVTPENLGKLRDAIMARIEALELMKPGSADLKEADDKARSMISSARRGMLKFMDDPPHFGDRGNGVAWHRHLDGLNAETGFSKSVSMKEVYDDLLKQIDSGANPWAPLIERSGLLQAPYVSAVKPDAALLAKDKADKQNRLDADLSDIEKSEGETDPQKALEKFAADASSKTAELAARDAAIPRPDFVKDPPLTLDDVDYKVETGKAGRGVVRTLFGSTPFTEVELDFDLSGVPARDLDLLVALSPALTDVGATLKSGETLDYVKAQERSRSEIYGLSSGLSFTPRAARYELSLTAEGSTPQEVDKSVEWLENYLIRRSTGAAARERLIDILRQDIQSGRNIFQQPEEYWVQGAAAAYEHQDQPIYMAGVSPFTALRERTRLRWRLESPAPEKKAEYDKTLSALAAAAKAETREQLTARLEKTEGELGETLRFELAHLPPDSWRPDLARVLAETRADIDTPAGWTMSRIQGLLDRVLTQQGARVHLTGDAANTEHGAALADALLARLPRGAAGRVAPSGRPLVLARLKERVPELRDARRPPVHVALVNNGTKTGVHVETAPGPNYHSRRRQNAIDFLASEAFGGAAPHSFFMQTWSAGLAYSNGVHPSAASGRVGYYAERCPDLAQTMRFVVDLASRTAVSDPFFVEYALSNAFRDYRGAGDFASRGAALAVDLTDGDTPEAVKGFKQLLIKTAAEPGVGLEIQRRVPAVLGRVLVGLGPKVSQGEDASAFVIGPDDLLTKYEDFLRRSGETNALVRLYPRDFWPDPER